MEIINQFLTTIFGWLANGLTFGFFFCSIGFYIASTKEKPRTLSIDLLKAVLATILLANQSVTATLILRSVMQF